MRHVVWDVTNKKAEVFYLVCHDVKKIYRFKESEKELVKRLTVTSRWYDDEFQEMVKRGYELVENIEDIPPTVGYKK